MFPDGEMVRDLQTELDGMIEAGVAQITRLLKNSDTRTSNTAADNEETFIMDQRKRHTYRGIKLYRQIYVYYQVDVIITRDFYCIITEFTFIPS